MSPQLRNRFLWVSFSLILWMASLYWFYLIMVDLDKAEILDPSNTFDPFNGAGTKLVTTVLSLVGTPLLLTLWWKLSKNFPSKILFFKFIRPQKIGFFLSVVCLFEFLNFVILFLIANDLSNFPNGSNLAALFLAILWFLHFDIFRFILSQPRAAL